ncbi:MAG: glutamate--tRNA ligase [Methanobacterium formicicum]
MDKLEEIIRKYALINAAKHGGQAQPGAVIGMIMSKHPEYRQDAGQVSKTAGQIVSTINKMPLDAQSKELEQLGGYQEKKVEKVKGLVDLPEVDGEVVLRFAPNPSGPLHIGHARAAVLNQEYRKRYGGKLILRVEDTDPRRVDPEAYQMIDEDLHWMGVEWDEKVIQSDRMEIYYQHAQDLIKQGGAYMCTCPGDVFKELKDSSCACPHRDASVEENLELWEKMPETEEGEMVLRVKTDIKHKNPAIRDWVAMRVVDDAHPRVGSKYKVYPMMNFSVSVDDHLLGVTHVLRGKDHLANSEKQEYLYQHMGWEVPQFIHYGRLKMDDVRLSTSQARKGIEEGTYSGWDDPRLGTIRAIARRGIQSEAIKELMLEIGVKIADSTVTWKKIYGLNRAFLEEKANRYFMVENPQLVEIKGIPEKLLGTVERPLHPDHLDRGMRKLDFNGNVYLDGDDIPSNPDEVLRLMDAVNITFQDGKAQYHSEGIDEAREAKAKIVQWVPKLGRIETELVMPDASTVTGFAEQSLSAVQVDDVVQLERIGFARLDQAEDGKLRFYYAHK